MSLELHAVNSPLFYELLHYILPRYLRICCHSSQPHLLSEVIEKLNTRLGLDCIDRVQWISCYIVIPGYIPIREVYEALADMDHVMTIFPMDIASAIPSHILSQYHPKTSLDLCCSPGGKLITLMDYSRLSPWGHQCAVGVDISHKRLQICQSILHSYLSSQYRIDQNSIHYIPRVMLFCADGTTFSSTNLGQLVYDTHVDLEDIISSSQTGRKRQNKSSRGRTKKRLRAIQSSLEGDPKEDDEEELTTRQNPIPNRFGGIDKYDVVLVDAQCTHDGSYRHMRYGNSNSHDDDDSKDDLTPPSHPIPEISQSHVTKNVKHEIFELESLQRGLILSGFKRLKPGGVMIYSTCSHERAQNEDIVTWLLNIVTAENKIDSNVGTAILIPLPEWTASTTHASPTNSLLSSLLDSSDDALFTYLINISQSSSSPNSTSMKNLSHDICRHISTLASPMGRSAAELPETLYFGRWGGTSGLYIACIQKR